MGFMYLFNAEDKIRFSICVIQLKTVWLKKYDTGFQYVDANCGNKVECTRLYTNNLAGKNNTDKPNVQYAIEPAKANLQYFGGF